MDTAQRNMGLDAAATRELITPQRRRGRGPSAARSWSASTPTTSTTRSSRSTRSIDAYIEQLHFAEDAGAGVVLMASRHLARAATGRRRLRARLPRGARARRRPRRAALARRGVRPGARRLLRLDRHRRGARDACCASSSDNADRVERHQDEPARRRRRDRRCARGCPRTRRMFTGDDFNYVGLIAGDERARTRTRCSARSPPLAPQRLRRDPGARRRRRRRATARSSARPRRSRARSSPPRPSTTRPASPSCPG